MRRVILWLLAGVTPALMLALVGLGCSGDKPSTPGKDNAGGGGSGAARPKDSDAQASDNKPIDFSGGRGTLKGKVTLEGLAAGDIKTLDDQLRTQMQGNESRDVCLAADATPLEKEQQDYRVGAGNGLENVVVWVKPAGMGQNYKLEDADLKPYKDGAEHEKSIDQPHCAFLPHVLVTFPQYRDGTALKPTGQVVKVKNSSTINHNTKWGGTPKNPGGNPMISPKGDVTLDLVPENQEIPLKCNIHGFMGGYIWAFDHPFATKTDKDGNFEIKGLPAGAKLKVVFWHEKLMYNVDKGGKTGTDITVPKDGTTTHNVAAKK